MQELYLVKACRVNFNQTAEICQNLTQSNETKLLQTEIQKFVAELQVKTKNKHVTSFKKLSASLKEAPLLNKFYAARAYKT